MSRRHFPPPSDEPPEESFDLWSYPVDVGEEDSSGASALAWCIVAVAFIGFVAFCATSSSATYGPTERLDSYENMTTPTPAEPLAHTKSLNQHHEQQPTTEWPVELIVAAVMLGLVFGFVLSFCLRQIARVVCWLVIVVATGSVTQYLEMQQILQLMKSWL